MTSLNSSQAYDIVQDDIATVEKLKVMLKNRRFKDLETAGITIVGSFSGDGRSEITVKFDITDTPASESSE